MRSTDATRMPPQPFAPPTATELEAFAAWVADGSPAGGCNDPIDTGPDPYGTPVVCTSQAYWTRGDEESPSMHPGMACIDCHTREREGPENLAIAGTLYPTAHEPDDCNGVASSSGAEVVVTEANGREHRFKPNGAGNFFMENEEFVFPYTAKVVHDGRERVMVEAQDDGDCNGCHTEAGANAAPGRIVLP